MTFGSLRVSFRFPHTPDPLFPTPLVFPLCFPRARITNTPYTCPQKCACLFRDLPPSFFDPPRRAGFLRSIRPTLPMRPVPPPHPHPTHAQAMAHPSPTTGITATAKPKTAPLFNKKVSLIKPVLGKVRTPSLLLPPPTHVYGARVQKDAEGVGQRK